MYRDNAYGYMYRDNAFNVCIYITLHDIVCHIEIIKHDKSIRALKNEIYNFERDMHS